MPHRRLLPTGPAAITASRRLKQRNHVAAPAGRERVRRSGDFVAAAAYRGPVTTPGDLDAAVPSTRRVPERAAEAELRRRLVVAGVVGCLMLGLASAVLGPSLPELRTR